MSAPVFPADVPIIDSHVHFWNPETFRYDWLSGTALLNRAYLPADYARACEGLPVESVVFVEAGGGNGNPIGEASWVAGLDGPPQISAIVAHAPLEDGANVEETLSRLASAPRVKGIRRNIQGEQDNDFCARPAFVESVRLLHKYNLSFDVCCRHDQLSQVTELVRQCPDVSFVLDHIGKPAIKNGTVDPWRKHLRKLSELPNVVCKLSGLATEADRERWTMEDLRPYVDHVLACFGFDRVLYGSDWPVALLATSYKLWVGTLYALTENCSINERRSLFAGNTRRVYRIY